MGIILVSAEKSPRIIIYLHIGACCQLVNLWEIKECPHSTRGTVTCTHTLAANYFRQRTPAAASLTANRPIISAVLCKRPHVNGVDSPTGNSACGLTSEDREHGISGESRHTGTSRRPNKGALLPLTLSYITTRQAHQ
jgi:hypothetical protein